MIHTITLRACDGHGSETPIRLVVPRGDARITARFALLPQGLCLGGGTVHTREDLAPVNSVTGSLCGLNFAPLTQALAADAFTAPGKPAVFLTEGVPGRITVWDGPGGLGYCRFSGSEGHWWRPSSSTSVNAQLGVAQISVVDGDITRYARLYAGAHEGSLWVVPGSNYVLLVYGGIWWQIDAQQRILPVSVVIGQPLIFLGQLRCAPLRSPAESR